MNNVQEAPAGWTLSRFKAVCADVSSWTWGTVQGAFNEKASLSQIIVDAVIGMIPLVGDATAVRDLIAVIIGLSSSEEKRNSKWEWVLLVILLFALIPVLGGVIKGVGRITIKVAKQAAHLTGAAKAAHLKAGAAEIVEFLNRIGMKNAEKWLLSLRIADHSAEILGKLKVLTITFDRILARAGAKFGAIPGLRSRIVSLRSGIEKVRLKADEMIPVAIKELDQQLREMQAFIRSGGETTSRLALHRATVGSRTVTRTRERRMVENGLLPARTVRGGFRQNPASGLRMAELRKFYKPRDGFPNLLDLKNPKGYHEKVAAFSGLVRNRQLKGGEEVFRFFGPARTTHGVPVDESSAGGAWWGLGAPPKTAKEWREYAAVLDSFNGDGFLVSARVVDKTGPNAVVGTVSEQFGKEIPGQYLPGGATQAFFYLNRDFSEALTKAGQEFAKGGTVSSIIDPTTGMQFTFHRTGWSDANGIWGYVNMPGPGSIQTMPVGTSEQATKENREVVVQP